MKFDITGLSRIVELDDNIVSEYCKCSVLSEDIFVIAVISEYGHEPTVAEVSDEELSQLCNAALLTELKAFALLPAALEMIGKHRQEWEVISDAGIPVSIPLESES